jgi:polyhydroxyalkanoate synthesis regulator phasin
MPASKSSSSGGSRRSGAGSKPATAAAKTRATDPSAPAATRAGSKSATAPAPTDATDPSAGELASRPGGAKSFVEQLVSHVINPLGLVVLTQERLQDTLDEAAARGRLTRSDATEIAAELIRRGRLQTEELLTDAERLIGRGREQLDAATMRSRFSDGMERLVRTADRARRTVGVGPSFPILGYDDLTAAQVNARLKGLSPSELRKVREYERRHANRKSVLDGIEKALQ